MADYIESWLIACAWYGALWAYFYSLIKELARKNWFWLAMQIALPIIAVAFKWGNPFLEIFP